MSRKERPILMSAPNVRPTMDGRKTQTRRVFKAKNGGLWPNMNDQPGMRQILRNCPYGQPGDRLWVRETWQGPLLAEFETDADADWYRPSNIHQYQNPKHCLYAADGGPPPEFMTADDELVRRWKPSIHMPRWASRITLEITGVRVERVQDIDIADASAEGVTDTGSLILDKAGNEQGGPIAEYAVLWESINGPGSWEQNPWVWVIEFKRVVTA